MLPNTRLWTGAMEVEPEAIEQIRQVSMLPILAGPVAVMPDVHQGHGRDGGERRRHRAARSSRRRSGSTSAAG